MDFWTLFVVGSPFFYVAALLAFSFIVWAIEWESGWVAAFICALALTIFYIMGSGKDWFQWIGENPWLFAQYILSYVAFGVVWATFNWWLFCRERVAKYEELKRKWLGDNGIDPFTKTIPPEKRKKWIEFLSAISHGDGKDRWCVFYTKDNYILKIKPRAWEFKVDISRDLMWWPASFFWWLCHGFILGFYNNLQRLLGGFYNWIADKVFHNVEEDTTLPPLEDIINNKKM